MTPADPDCESKREASPSSSSEPGRLEKSKSVDENMQKEVAECGAKGKRLSMAAMTTTKMKLISEYNSTLVSSSEASQAYTNSLQRSQSLALNSNRLSLDHCIERYLKKNQMPRTLDSYNKRISLGVLSSKSSACITELNKESILTSRSMVCLHVKNDSMTDTDNISNRKSVSDHPAKTTISTSDVPKTVKVTPTKGPTLSTPSFTSVTSAFDLTSSGMFDPPVIRKRRKKKLDTISTLLQQSINDLENLDIDAQKAVTVETAPEFPISQLELSPKRKENCFDEKVEDDFSYSDSDVTTQLEDYFRKNSQDLEDIQEIDENFMKTSIIDTDDNTLRSASYVVHDEADFATEIELDRHLIELTVTDVVYEDIFVTSANICDVYKAPMEDSPNTPTRALTPVSDCPGSRPTTPEPFKVVRRF